MATVWAKIGVCERWLVGISRNFDFINFFVRNSSVGIHVSGHSLFLVSGY